MLNYWVFLIFPLLLAILTICMTQAPWNSVPYWVSPKFQKGSRGNVPKLSLKDLDPCSYISQFLIWSLFRSQFLIWRSAINKDLSEATMGKGSLSCLLRTYLEDVMTRRGKSFRSLSISPIKRTIYPPSLWPVVYSEGSCDLFFLWQKGSSFIVSRLFLLLYHLPGCPSSISFAFWNLIYHSRPITGCNPLKFSQFLFSLPLPCASSAKAKT